MSTVTFEPELEIGTEIYKMDNNKICFGLMFGYRAWVTSNVDGLFPFITSLFERFLHKTHKVYKYDFEYKVRFEHDTMTYTLEKVNNFWCINNKRVYFSKEELLEQLNKLK